MKQSKTTIKELTKRYRAVLLKCALINMAAFGLCVSTAAAEDLIWTEGTKDVSATENYDSVNISGGTVNFQNTTGFMLSGEGNVSISGGELNFYNYGSSISHSGSGNIAITGGTFTVDDGIQDGNNAFVHEGSGNITVSNGTFNGVVFTKPKYCATGYGNNCDGSTPISYPDGKIRIEDGTFNHAHIWGSRLIEITGGTFNNGADIGWDTGEINISGGTFSGDVGFEASGNFQGGTGNITISDGTFNGVTSFNAGNTLTITGGSFLNENKFFITDAVISAGEFNGETFVKASNDITVSGGTFSGEEVDFEADNITLSGGTFSGNELEFEADGTLLINSDTVSIAQNPGNRPTYEFKAGTINITGANGITVRKTSVTASEISGKITGNQDAWIGNFSDVLDKWSYQGKTLYSVWPDDFSEGALTFDSANLTLNGNAVAGAGVYSWDIDSSDGSNISSVQLKPVQSKLTTDEINASINLIMAEIERVDQISRDTDDLSLAINNGMDVPCKDDICRTYDPKDLDLYIEEKWASGQPLDYDYIRQSLEKAYSDYNNNLDDYSANVTIADSAITMNDTAALANYSIADDEKGNITVNNSTVTANGTNTISASKGEISFENNSALTVSNGAVLSIVSENDNTVSFDATSGLNVNGTVNGNIAFAGANGKVKANNGTVRGTLSVAENTVLDMSGNSQIDALNVDKLISANGKLAIDIDAARKVADTLTVGAESSGTLTISALNGIQAGQDFSVEVLKGAGVGNITLALSDELTAAYGSEQERHETRTENLKADSAWTDTYGTFDWIITEEQQLAVNGGKVTYSSSVTEQKGEALDTQDTLMLVNTNATLSAKSFKTTDAQAEYAATADLGETKGAVTVSGAKDGNAVSTIALGNHSGFIVNSGATLKLDSVRITGDNGVLTVGTGATVSLNNIVLEGSVTNNGTLDIGESTLVATNISGGILKATLTDAAKTSAIVTADAENVTLALDMSKAARGDEATLYHVTDGTGFTFGEYDIRRYAVSTASFDKNAAKEMAVLGNWTGGDLYIMKLATAAEGAVEDLKNIGVSVSANEEKAIEVLNDEVIEKLAPAQKAAAQKINDLLETAAASGDTTQMKQILREVAPEAAPSASQTASSNAGAVISVVGTRMGGGSPAPAAGSGRSGGDYTVGAASIWAQGMYNKADLHKAD